MGDEEEEQLKKKLVKTLQFELEIVDKSVFFLFSSLISKLVKDNWTNPQCCDSRVLENV